MGVSRKNFILPLVNRHAYLREIVDERRGSGDPVGWDMAEVQSIEWVLYNLAQLTIDNHEDFEWREKIKELIPMDHYKANLQKIFDKEVIRKEKQKAKRIL